MWAHELRDLLTQIIKKEKYGGIEVNVVVNDNLREVESVNYCANCNKFHISLLRE